MACTWSMMRFLCSGTAASGMYSLSLHDALPISGFDCVDVATEAVGISRKEVSTVARTTERSEEHTSELQSPMYLVCRLLLEKKHEGCTHPVPPLRDKHQAATGRSDVPRTARRRL